VNGSNGINGSGGNPPLGFSFTRDDDHFTAASVRYGDKSLNYLHVDDDYYPLHSSHYGHYYHHHHHGHYPYHGYPYHYDGYYDYYSPIYWPGYAYCAPRYGYSYASLYFGTPYFGAFFGTPYYGGYGDAGYVDPGYVDYDATDDYNDDVVIYGDDVYVSEENSDYGAYAPPAMPAPAPAPSYSAPQAQPLESFGDRGTPYGEIQPLPQGAQTPRVDPPAGNTLTSSPPAAQQGPPPPIDEKTGWGPVLSEGNDAFAAGDYEGAKRLYIRAIMVDERDGYAKMLYAWANFALRDYELAATSIRRALLTTPDLMQYPLDVRSLYKDVNVFEVQLRDLQKHVFDKPQDREAKLLLAYLYFSVGEPHRAEAFLSELTESDGQDQTVKQLREASVKAQEILKARQQGSQPASPPL
jgi:tetratricopeptide (TPR) repeat protein